MNQDNQIERINLVSSSSDTEPPSPVLNRRPGTPHPAALFPVREGFGDLPPLELPAAPRTPILRRQNAVYFQRRGTMGPLRRVVFPALGVVSDSSSDDEAVGPLPLVPLQRQRAVSAPPAPPNSPVVGPVVEQPPVSPFVVRRHPDRRGPVHSSYAARRNNRRNRSNSYKARSKTGVRNWADFEFEKFHIGKDDIKLKGRFNGGPVEYPFFVQAPFYIRRQCLHSKGFRVRADVLEANNVPYKPPAFCCNNCSRVYVNGSKAGCKKFYCHCPEYHALCARCTKPNGYRLACEDCHQQLSTKSRRRSIAA